MTTTKLPDWRTNDYWRVSKNGHAPGSFAWQSETVETDEGVFYRWQLLERQEEESGRPSPNWTFSKEFIRNGGYAGLKR